MRQITYDYFEESIAVEANEPSYWAKKGECNEVFFKLKDGREFKGLINDDGSFESVGIDSEVFENHLVDLFHEKTGDL